MNTNIAIIIVTRNSEKFIEKCMQSIMDQTKQPDQIILSDTGSNSTAYLEKFDALQNVTRIDAGKDVGFCKGNNAAMKSVKDNISYVLLLNPDAFLFPDFLEKATEFMDKNPHCGICTGNLLGYDIAQNEPTGLYDSRGIFQTWYGKWYDRDQGNTAKDLRHNQIEEVPAICGALMFCRRATLNKTLLPGANIFDPTFYMYKEDIDLSLRVKKAGWTTIYNPTLQAYHCRGWAHNRKVMAKQYRVASARNELKIHWRERAAVPIAYSSLKYFAVKVFNR